MIEISIKAGANFRSGSPTLNPQKTNLGKFKLHKRFCNNEQEDFMEFVAPGRRVHCAPSRNTSRRRTRPAKGTPLR